MSAYRTLGLVLLVLGSATTSGLSQSSQPSGDTVNPGLASALSQMRANAALRAFAGGDGLHTGTLDGRTAQDLLLREDSALRQVPLRAIDTLWVRRSATGRSALIGGILGLAVGGILGAAYPVESDGNEAAMVGIGAGGGAALGALVGAVAGSISRQWVRVYPR
ncbi:MAG TPA: hypothetical protein VMN37_05645 [Gemmatimonadales bacterium]|nr:hypothetical protein [Gemmatimonadales bacterium]